MEDPLNGRDLFRLFLNSLIFLFGQKFRFTLTPLKNGFKHADRMYCFPTMPKGFDLFSLSYWPPRDLNEIARLDSQYIAVF